MRDINNSCWLSAGKIDVVNLQSLLISNASCINFDTFLNLWALTLTFRFALNKTISQQFYDKSQFFKRYIGKY